MSKHLKVSYIGFLMRGRRSNSQSRQVSLIIGKCRPQDEDEYTLEVKNIHGKDEVGAKLLVTPAVETNLDFRAKLKKRDASISEAEKQCRRASPR